MALTGRTALLAALGSLPVGILAPSWTGMLAVNAPSHWQFCATTPWPRQCGRCSSPDPVIHPFDSVTAPKCNSP